MKRTAWYVIQVQVSKEQVVTNKIVRACQTVDHEYRDAKTVLQECFSPRYAYQHKQNGAWIEETMPLLPGYLIAVTEDPWKLLDHLRGVPEFTKLLPTGKTFAPLDEEEKSWIEKWTKEGDRIIPMSYAYKEGDKLVITEGPLKGREALIERVNRRKSVAHLGIHAGVITIHTTVGLNVLPGEVSRPCGGRG